jgi:hypothetical protein
MGTFSKQMRAGDLPEDLGGSFDPEQLVEVIILELKQDQAALRKKRLIDQIEEYRASRKEPFLTDEEVQERLAELRDGESN